MLLRVRVTLPDRPGALGQVARTLGDCGADIVAVVVLERSGGRATDDFTVVWPSAAQVDRLLAGLAAVPGVRLDGLWHVSDAPGGYDAQVLAQLAGNPADGLATLVDAVPGMFAADWAAAVEVPADWADRRASGGSMVVRASWQAPPELPVPEVSPVRARELTGPDGVRYAVAPFERDGLVLVAARVAGDRLPPARFHRTEVDRLAQLVRAAGAVLGDRLAPPPAQAARHR